MQALQRLADRLIAPHGGRVGDLETEQPGLDTGCHDPFEQSVREPGIRELGGGDVHVDTGFDPGITPLDEVT